MWNVSSASADHWYVIFNIALFIGALIVAISTYGQMRMGAAKEYFANERIAANETETARAKESAAQANERAANANERAELAKRENLEIQQILLPRFFPTDADSGPLGEKYAALKPFAGMEVQIFVVPDFSCEKYASQIVSALQAAGWKVLPAKVTPTSFDGVSVYARHWFGSEPPREIVSKAGQALVDVFNEIARVFGVGRRMPMTVMEEGILPNVGRYKRPPGIVTITIGLPETYESLMLLRDFGPSPTTVDKEKK